MMTYNDVSVGTVFIKAERVHRPHWAARILSACMPWSKSSKELVRVGHVHMLGRKGFALPDVAIQKQSRSEPRPGHQVSIINSASDMEKFRPDFRLDAWPLDIVSRSSSKEVHVWIVYSCLVDLNWNIYGVQAYHWSFDRYGNLLKKYAPDAALCNLRVVSDIE